MVEGCGYFPDAICGTCGVSTSLTQTEFQRLAVVNMTPAHEAIWPQPVAKLEPGILSAELVLHRVVQIPVGSSPVRSRQTYRFRCQALLSSAAASSSLWSSTPSLPTLQVRPIEVLRRWEERIALGDELSGTSCRVAVVDG